MFDMANTSSRVDYFRTVPLDFYDEHNGEVEAPTGSFGIFEQDNATRGVMFEEFGLDGESVPDGYYLIITNSDGLVWAWQGSEDEVTDEYNKREAEYHRWLQSDEAPEAVVAEPTVVAEAEPKVSKYPAGYVVLGHFDDPADPGEVDIEVFGPFSSKDAAERWVAQDFEPLFETVEPHQRCLVQAIVVKLIAPDVI